MKNKKSQIWNSRLGDHESELNVLFCAGRDVQKLPMADEVLLPFDIWTNRAHSIMLEQQGLISKSTLKSILEGLNSLDKLVKSGKFYFCLLYTSPSPRDGLLSRMPSSA